MEKGGYSVISCGRYLEIQETADSDSSSVSGCLPVRKKDLTLHLFPLLPEEDLDFWFNYFDFHTDYQAILNAVRPEDTYLAAAGKTGNGIRILRQDLWEMIITFYYLPAENHSCYPAGSRTVKQAVRLSHSDFLNLQMLRTRIPYTHFLKSSYLLLPWRIYKI